MRVAAVLAVVALAGCASSTTARDDGRLTEAELSWVRDYVGWRDGMSRATRGDDPAAGLTVLASCGRSLAREVGRAPTLRLRRVERLARRSCGEWRRYTVLAHRFFDREDIAAGVPMTAAQTHAREAEELAFDRLDALLSESRPLPRVARASAMSRIQTRYTAVANRVTSRSVQVRCWDRDTWAHVLREAAAFEDRASVDADGFANFYSGRMSLGPTVCTALDDLTYRAKRPARGEDLNRAAYAVLALAHESEHLAGVDDEALATCNGMQHIAVVAELLGVDRSYARKLEDAFWRDTYADEPPDYRTPSCTEDGPLDLSPGDGVWP